MGEQRNLTEENVEELKEKLNKMKETNPDLKYRFFPQTEETAPYEEKATITVVLEKLETLDRKIDLIFGDHVLVRGRFTNISNKL